MHILITTDTVGGVWYFTAELAAGLLRRGWMVTLVSLGRLPSTSQQQWARTLRGTFSSTFCYVPLDTPLEWMERNAAAYNAAEPILLDLIRRSRIDLVHSSQFCFGALCTRESVPVLITAHSDVLSWADACRATVLECTPWLEDYTKLVHEGLAKASAVAAPTAWMLQQLEMRYSLPDERVVIPNGCSVPASATGSLRKLQVVSAGRLWDEGKGVGILKEVSSPIPLMVAGDKRHEQAEMSFDLGKDVTLLGVLSREETLTLFRRSAMYLCTSLYEPFGLAPLEAALCGCAVLARDIPSMREVWGDAALYFTNASELSSLLVNLHQDGCFLERAQRVSQLRAQQFSACTTVNRYEALYRRLLTPGSVYAA